MIRSRVLASAERRLRKACDSLPMEISEERYREWVAELPSILDDPNVRPAPIRWFWAWFFSVDQARTVARLGRAPTLFDRSRGVIQTLNWVMIIEALTIIGLAAGFFLLAEGIAGWLIAGLATMPMIAFCKFGHRWAASVRAMMRPKK